MLDIIIKEKPEKVSFDEIHKILFFAHRDNIENGMIMKTATLTGKQLKERIGKDGMCFVALYKEKLVGTISVRFVERNTWYAKGIIPDYILAGVIPEYQGKHINTMLANKVFEYVKEKGYELIELDTAFNNKRAIKIYEHQGFIPVNFCAFSGVDHYSIVMIKWLNKPRYSKVYCKIRYNIKRFLVCLRYKKGRIKRFGI